MVHWQRAFYMGEWHSLSFQVSREPMDFGNTCRIAIMVWRSISRTPSVWLLRMDSFNVLTLRVVFMQPKPSYDVSVVVLRARRFVEICTLVVRSIPDLSAALNNKDVLYPRCSYSAN
jgi:hypothetical protein